MVTGTFPKGLSLGPIAGSCSRGLRMLWRCILFWRANGPALPVERVGVRDRRVRTVSKSLGRWARSHLLKWRWSGEQVGQGRSR